MRILYFHQHFSTPAGAAGLRSYQFAKYMVDHGHDVTMVCGSYHVGDTGLKNEFSHGRREGCVDGINIIEFDLAYSNADSFIQRTTSFLKFAAKSVAIAMTARYDLLFATSTPLTAGIPGIVAKLIRRKPFVFEVRDLWPELPREMGVIRNKFILGSMGALEWLSYRCADRCIGLSPGIVKGITRRGIPTHRVAMIPNGSDLVIFDPKLPGKWRPESVQSGDFMAVFTGTHGIANGLDAVLNAAAELKRRSVNNIKIVLIGHGKLKPDLQKRAERDGLDNCIFLNSVPKARLADLLREADLGLMILANIPAFYYGTSPNKFFDYIAAGLPVLTNYPGWLADLIAEYKLGYAVPPDDSHAFADALIEAQSARSDPKSRAAIADRFAKKHFAWPDLAANFEKTLIDAIDLKQPPN